MAAQHAAPKIIRRKEVEARTGLSRSSIYAKLRRNKKRPGDFDPTFPRPVSIGSKAVGWVDSEVSSWIEARIKTARKEGGAP
ncbi:MAG: AlpA family phage regulatory protein [Gammaproteobacteria bacterium]|nr:AlpA family phage regulatory protein [Gammaproteobacteria bacterium]